MDDVDIAMGDNNKTQSLENTYGYKKEKIEFDGINNLATSDYLGGKQT